ncbi:hypothetical protein SCT_2624 [Sulfuricella sp. T08]|uniref:hypothetical protein n=1 Tax=Sulfuricella sp. T08 TaxID=1632857 RepID=UPI0006179CB6|nr:hypothetical protein [Sulfuricella sp. T08]GAO37206.1 hypothetical protein SCT_2624 [Sulfuricella sp. T08]
MKFHDLDIGQRFELDGVAYVKTSPVLAGQAEGGGSRFMPRYVMVKLLDGAAPRAKAEQEKMLRAGEVLAAFEVYHSACREGLEKLAGELPVDRLLDIANVLEGERQGFLDAVLKG